MVPTKLFKYCEIGRYRLYLLRRFSRLQYLTVTSVTFLLYVYFSVKLDEYLFLRMMYSFIKNKIIDVLQF